MLAGTRMRTGSKDGGWKSVGRGGIRKSMTLLYLQAGIPGRRPWKNSQHYNLVTCEVKKIAS